MLDGIKMLQKFLPLPLAANPLNQLPKRRLHLRLYRARTVIPPFPIEFQNLFTVTSLGAFS